jgi:predicted ATP-grasp superfamily ATP-dependent carboligase
LAGELQRPAVLIPTDDEAAVLVAEHATALNGAYLLPELEASLPRRLATKHIFYDECRKFGISAPGSLHLEHAAQAIAVADGMRFPVVLKNSAPWLRLKGVVHSTKIVTSRAELVNLASQWPADIDLVVQEFIPSEVSEDWIVHICRSARGVVAGFTGKKVRAWPPRAGVTSYAVSCPNRVLLSTASQFCEKVGYLGIVDMDWRLDKRVGIYNLLDFNPRLGANFRLFVDKNGNDVVRAHYLEMTNQGIRETQDSLARAFCVENLDIASKFATRRESDPADWPTPLTTEYAWFATDDVLPFLTMVVQFGHVAVRKGVSLAIRAAGSFRAYRGGAS